MVSFLTSLFSSKMWHLEKLEGSWRMAAFYESPNQVAGPAVAAVLNVVLI